MSDGCCIHSSKVQLSKVKHFTGLRQARGTDGELLLLETLREVLSTWLSAKYFCHRDAVSATAHHCGEVPSPQTNHSLAPATSTGHYVDVDGKAS